MKINTRGYIIALFIQHGIFNALSSRSELISSSCTQLVKTDWKVKNGMKQNLIVRKQWLSPWDLEFRKTFRTQVAGVKCDFHETKVGRCVTSIMSAIHSIRPPFVLLCFFFSHFRSNSNQELFKDNSFVKCFEIMFELARGRQWAGWV